MKKEVGKKTEKKERKKNIEKRRLSRLKKCISDRRKDIPCYRNEWTHLKNISKHFSSIDFHDIIADIGR